MVPVAPIELRRAALTVLLALATTAWGCAPGEVDGNLDCADCDASPAPARDAQPAPDDVPDFVPPDVPPSRPPDASRPPQRDAGAAPPPDDGVRPPTDAGFPPPRDTGAPPRWDSGSPPPPPPPRDAGSFDTGAGARDVSSPGDPCGTSTSCGACTPRPGCGWCRSLGRCYQGSWGGATSGACTGSREWAFLPAECASDPPRADAGSSFDAGGRVDTGSPVDSALPRPDAPPPGDVEPPRPAGDVEWMSWAEQHSRANTRWGTQLTDIIRHLPLSYGDTYADSDLVTYGHETTHGINAHLRNHFNRTGRRANGFYCMNNRGAIVVEPNIRKSQVVPYVPSSLRGSRFNLYLLGSSSWDDTPLYVWDEWVAYTNGSEVGVGLSRAGMWSYGWRDAVAGTLEFVVYGLAVGMAVEERDPSYFRTNTQFRAFLAWNARRSMDLYREGSVMASFRWDRQDAYYRALRESPDAEALREFARRTFGRAWAAEVLGLAP